MKPTRRLAEHIEASTHLRDLAKKAAQLNAATKTLRSVLPDELGRHAAVARVSTQEVVIITDTGAWATRLKMMEKLITGACSRGDNPQPPSSRSWDPLPPTKPEPPKHHRNRASTQATQPNGLRRTTGAVLRRLSTRESGTSGG